MRVQCVSAKYMFTLALMSEASLAEFYAWPVHICTFEEFESAVV